MRRTRSLTGRGAPLFYGVGAWNGLSVFLEYGFALRKSFIIFAGAADGANLRTVPAAGTFRKVYKTRLLVNRGCKISWIAIKCFDFRVCNELNVQVPADLDQFR